MLTYIGQSNLCMSKVLYPNFKVIGYTYYEVSFLSLLYWTPRGVCKAGRTDMVPKHEIYRVENPSVQSLHNELRLHGPMHILWYIGHC